MLPRTYELGRAYHEAVHVLPIARWVAVDIVPMLNNLLLISKSNTK